MTTQEKRIFKLAGALAGLLKKTRRVDLRGGHWEIGYDFAHKPRLRWHYNSSGDDPFEIIPSTKQIVGLGALDYAYAEKKLGEAIERLAQ